MKLMIWKSGLMAVLVEKGARDGTRAAAERVLSRANETVPYREGTLMSTGAVSTDGVEAAVSYDTVYAARLHQHPEYNFQGSGRGRWLQLALEEDKADTLEAMADPVRKSFRRGVF